MDFSAVADFLQHFQTENVIQFLQGMNADQLVYNPWFLGTMGVLAVVSLLMRWRLLLVTILSITGFTWLISYTLEQGTNLEKGGTDTMVVFVMGGAVLVFLIIYLLFIRPE